MPRKLCALLLTILMFAVFSVSAFANSDGKGGMTLNEFIKSRDIKETDQFLATITKPVGDETTFKRSYVVCGYSDLKDICIAVAVYNSSLGQYVYITKDNFWEVSGIFTKEIPLHLGANRLKIVAFPKSEINNLKAGVNAQVTYFTVTVLKESVKDKIIQGVLKVKDTINSFFGN